jgi:geranylgeranylglycerol-phosphate geranylgeranyltransferase
VGTLSATIKLARPHTTLLAFLTIFAPVFAQTRDATASLTVAAPLLFVSMCTFLLNDLDDVEKDRINHPYRPLPRGEITPTLVVIIYYFCLAVALFSIRFGVKNTRAAFLYYVLLILAVNYSYIVEYLAVIKAPYVAGVSTLPILIVAALYPHRQELYLTSAAFFIFNLGRELCRDVMDRAGDIPSPIHNVDPVRVARSGFSLQAAALLLVVVQVESLRDLAICMTMVILLGAAYIWWFDRQRPFAATEMSKVAMYLGLNFLI